MKTSLPLLDSGFPLPLEQPFTAAAARDAGIPRHELRRLTEAGLVRRLIAGVYVAAQTEDSQLLRARAIRLLVPERAVVTDEAAGWLAGARMILPPGSHLATPPVTIFSTERGGRLRNGLCTSGTRDLLPSDIVEIHGVRATSPLRTACDLGRLRSRDRSLWCMDSLLALREFDLDALLDDISRFKGFRGVRQLRTLAPLADRRSESPGESALRLRFYDAVLPAPVAQLEIWSPDGEFLGRADLAIEALRFIAEYDGERWHGADAQSHDEQRREAFRDAGWTVCVLRRENLYGARPDAEQILRDGVREARANLGIGRAEQALS